MTPLELAAGNPGALNVLHALWSRDDVASMAALRDLGFRGADIWVAFKDFAGEDLAKLQAALAAKDPALVAAVQANRDAEARS